MNPHHAATERSPGSEIQPHVLGGAEPDRLIEMAARIRTMASYDELPTAFGLAGNHKCLDDAPPNPLLPVLGRRVHAMQKAHRMSRPTWGRRPGENGNATASHDTALDLGNPYLNGTLRHLMTQVVLVFPFHLVQVPVLARESLRSTHVLVHQSAVSCERRNVSGCSRSECGFWPHAVLRELRGRHPTMTWWVLQALVRGGPECE